jgi:hypothetical protein
MCGNDRGFGYVDIRVIKYEFSDVVGGYAGVISLRKAIVSDLDLAVV